ncbi:MAG: hypothetical protein IJ767_07015 [Bacteroidaceae bacterium]|nr:hypothetical protein [Bacteroidaceae bacterium]MBR1801223.1 hypothetical protein [Bacteroidaceae bacterium]
MRKKLLLIIALVAVSVLPAAAQGIVVYQTDGSMTIIPSAKVDHISMVEEEDTYVFGTWHLGFWKNGDNVIKFDGTEYMAFAGKEMVWGGKGGDPDTYSVKFYPRNKYFVATNVNNRSDVLRWYVYQQKEKLLVLRDGDVYRYFYPTKEEADKAIMEKYPSHTETSNINTILRYGSSKSNSTQTPMGKHFENRHVTTDEDRAWLLNPSNEPNTIAGLSRWVKKTVKLYPYGDPVPADVNQHAIGDCCACAVLASLAYLYPDFIKHIITDNADGTYTIKMYDPQGQPVDVCITSKILCDGNGNIGQATGKNNAVTWATILEKALIKWQTLYKVDEGVEGIGTENVAPLFTGCGDSFAFSPNSLHNSEWKLAIEHCLAEGKLCIGGFNVADLQCGKLKTVTGHAFTFMLADDENSLFVMRNPWGIEDVDGKLFIPDERTIVQTIDARIVDPGAAAPFLREDLKPYSPPKFIRRSTDLGVSPRLLNRHLTHPNSTELW